MNLQVDPQILAWCQADPARFERVAGELREGLVRNRCIYNGAPVPMTPVPLVLEPDVVDQLEEGSAAFANILDHVIALACEEPEVAAWFRWEPPIGDWIKAQGRNAIGTGVSRFDALLDDAGRLQFLEFNTDNPGGKSWNHLFSVTWLEHPELRPLLIDEVEPLFDRTLEQLYQAVVHHGSRLFGPQPLTIAFVDILDESGINEEHHLAAEYLTRRGLTGLVHDARRFTFRDGALFADDRRIHAVYRGMQAFEFLEYAGTEPLIEAYLADAALFLNSFRAILGSQKAILAFTSDPDNSSWFDRAQREAIQRFLPWTTRLSVPAVVDWEGHRSGLEPFLRHRQADLVLKPSSGSGGEGVVIGRTVSPEAWEAAWRDHLGNPGWVIQRYVTLPTLEIPVVRDGRVELERKYVNINPYVVNGAYTASLVRYSDNPVINVQAGGGVMPSYHRRRKPTV